MTPQEEEEELNKANGKPALQEVTTRVKMKKSSKCFLK
jgi:hypothetical protein